ncbi:aldoxime dehydratase [Plenodomus tracheiphilus IPT5]|uniref:Aldoxime dehydratase n=1 Tax=Plenodomus tracheiphilus IPT5 TaxID=1408161 RepID=A0A6A7AVG4_9PLEO|nr:aldoxime dehydratase [Plenodomus tracheiphilus IPT5]
MLDCAIPEHLRRERKCPVNTPANYVPPFPAYCARFPNTMNNLVMATIGVQYTDVTKDDGKGIATIKDLIATAPAAARPSFWEVVSVTDKRGAYNIAVLAYWPGTEVHQRWEIESGFKSWWENPDRETEGHGWFQEILRPTVERFETVFSNPENPEGAANMQERISGEMEEHAYWGSMRDRMAAAQDDELKAQACRTANGGANGNGGDASSTTRVSVGGKKNLCVIRSGQDWSDTLPAERKLYLETMHPVLVTGMNYLRDEGQKDGCYAMNLWDVVDSKTHKADRERTYGLGYFDDMASLEKWSKSHQTHINIFGGSLGYAKKLNNVLSLRLFHEVYVLEQEQQFFEYVGCHKESGMRNAVSEQNPET